MTTPQKYKTLFFDVISSAFEFMEQHFSPEDHREAIKGPLQGYLFEAFEHGYPTGKADALAAFDSFAAELRAELDAEYKATAPPP